MSELRELLAVLTLEQKVRLLTGADFWALYPEPAVGLRRLVVSDGPAGVRGEVWDERSPSANVPSPTALAASWDERRVARVGRLLAAQARAKGVDVILAPTVNLHRSPYGGGTSSASARIRCSVHASAWPTCAGYRTAASAPR